MPEAYARLRADIDSTEIQSGLRLLLRVAPVTTALLVLIVLGNAPAAGALLMMTVMILMTPAMFVYAAGFRAWGFVAGLTGPIILRIAISLSMS